jgi:hypothetical protein
MMGSPCLVGSGEHRRGGDASRLVRGQGDHGHERGGSEENRDKHGGGVLEQAAHFSISDMVGIDCQ